MKKNYKLIKFLKGVQINTFSKYSSTLKKIFERKCVKSLIKSLNAQKIIRDEDIFNEKFEKKEFEKKQSDNEDNNEKNLLEYTYEDYLQRQEEINKIRGKNKKIEPWSINDKTPRTPIIKNNFDSYKYHPNYNAIYKRVPSYSFIKSPLIRKISDKDIKFIELGPKLKLNIKLKKNLKVKNKKLKKLINIKTESNRKNNNPFLTSINFNSCKKKNKLQKEKFINSYDKNKHCFFFTEYSFSKRKIRTSPEKFKKYKLEPYNFFNSGKKIVNYKKMIPRNVKNSIYTYNSYNSKTPTNLLYKPKYDYIDPHTREICFDPKNRKREKKYEKMKIMKRIMTSYNISSEYLSVNNSKLRKVQYI